MLEGLLDRTLRFLKLRKSVLRSFSESEEEILKSAKLKIYKPTLECVNNISKGGLFEIQLIYTSTDGKIHQENFPIKIESNISTGIRFQIKIDNYLNNGSVLHKDSYGLTKSLTINNKGKFIYTNRDSVRDFKTNFPSKPQYLNGILANLKTFKNEPNSCYIRLIIQSNDSELSYPSSILDYKKNHLRFDYKSWFFQNTLIGIPFNTTKGMSVDVEINGNKFDFYALEPLNSLIIDSLNNISLDDFKNYSYVIRLCFAFLCGKFYKDDVIYLLSNDMNFNTIDDYEYILETPSIITINQIVNPTFFFQTFKERSEEEQGELEKYHKMFDSKLFSSLCNKVINHSELMRSIELIISAGGLSDSIQKGALYSVAIETMTEFLKELNPEVYQPIKDKKIAKKLRSEQLELLDKYSTDIDVNGMKILTAKIDNINSPTNRDKLVKPFEMYGVPLTQDDLDVLNHRNDYLHGGIPIDSDWKVELESNALKMHNLLSALVLSFIGYKGHYINLSGWYLLHLDEIQEISKNIDFDEIKSIIDMVNSGNINDLNIKEAIKRINDYEKFLKSVSQLESIINIIR